MKSLFKIRTGRRDAKMMEKGWKINAKLENIFSKCDKQYPEINAEKMRPPGYAWKVGG